MAMSSVGLTSRAGARGFVQMVSFTFAGDLCAENQEKHVARNMGPRIVTIPAESADSIPQREAGAEAQSDSKVLVPRKPM